MNSEERKITIIEGPPPTFEPVQPDTHSVLIGVLEGPEVGHLAVTRVRALNGPALVERCYRAWRDREMIPLEFRTALGTVQRVPIVAVRYVPTEEGDMLILWVLLTRQVLEALVEESGWADDAEDDEPFDLL